jgi:hypothetical protein
VSGCYIGARRLFRVLQNSVIQSWVHNRVIEVAAPALSHQSASDKSRVFLWRKMVLPAERLTVSISHHNCIIDHAIPALCDFTVERPSGRSDLSRDLVRHRWRRPCSRKPEASRARPAAQVVATARFSNTAHQRQNDYDNENKPKPSARIIAPSRAVRPGWQRSDQ